MEEAPVEIRTLPQEIQKWVSFFVPGKTSFYKTMNIAEKEHRRSAVLLFCEEGGEGWEL